MKIPLFARFASGGGLGMVKLIASFARVKILAILVGIAGIGVIAQVGQFALVALSLTSLSMAVGIINRIREPGRLGDRDAARTTRGTAFATLLVLIVLYLLMSFPLVPYLLEHIFHGNLGYWQFMPVLLGIPFAVFASGYIEGIFFSCNRYDLYVKASAYAAVLELGLYVALSVAYGLSGAILALGLSCVTLFVCFFWQMQKIGEPILELFPLRFEIEELIHLLRYGLVMLVAVALGYVSVLFIRGEVLQFYGAEANGLLQVPLALSAYSLPFITNGVWGHLHPSASQHGDTPEARQELLSVLNIVILLSAGASLTLLSIPEVLVSIAYTPSFLAALPLFPAQFLGDFFYFFAFTLSVYFLATSRLGIYLGGWVAYYAIYAGGGQWLLPKLGPLAVNISHAVASLLLAILGCMWLFYEGIFRIRNSLPLLAGTVVVMVAALMLWLNVPAIVRAGFLGTSLFSGYMLFIRSSIQICPVRD